MSTHLNTYYIQLNIILHLAIDMEMKQTIYKKHHDIGNNEMHKPTNYLI